MNAAHKVFIIWVVAVAIVIAISSICFIFYMNNKFKEEESLRMPVKRENMSEEQSLIMHSLLLKYNSTQCLSMSYAGILFVFHECSDKEWWEWFDNLPDEKKGEYFMNAIKMEVVDGIPVMNFFIVKEE